MKTTTAFFIDVDARRIDEIQIGDYRDIQKRIGCDLFTSADTLDNEDTLYVDDEGFINGTEMGFWWKGRMLAGNGLITGNDSSGDTQDVKSHLQDIEANVKFFAFGNTISDEVLSKTIQVAEEIHAGN